jgi:uncharacterized protein (TIGR03382 family)
MRTTVPLLIAAVAILAPATALPCEPMYYAPIDLRLPREVDPTGDWLVFSREAQVSLTEVTIVPSSGGETLTLGTTCTESAFEKAYCVARTPELLPATEYGWSTATGQSGSFRTASGPKSNLAYESNPEASPVKCEWHPPSNHPCGGNSQGFHSATWSVAQSGSREDLLLIRGEGGGHGTTTVVVPKASEPLEVRVRGDARCVETQWVRADGTLSEVTVHCGELSCPPPLPFGCSTTGKGASLAGALVALAMLVLRRRAA